MWVCSARAPTPRDRYLRLGTLSRMTQRGLLYAVVMFYSSRQRLDEREVFGAAVGVVEDVELLAGQTHAAGAVGAVAARSALDQVGRAGATLRVLAVWNNRGSRTTQAMRAACGGLTSGAVGAAVAVGAGPSRTCSAGSPGSRRCGSCPRSLRSRRPRGAGVATRLETRCGSWGATILPNDAGRMTMTLACRLSTIDFL